MLRLAGVFWRSGRAFAEALASAFLAEDGGSRLKIDLKKMSDRSGDFKEKPTMGGLDLGLVPENLATPVDFALYYRATRAPRPGRSPREPAKLWPLLGIRHP
jgi:hypothetical protein